MKITVNTNGFVREVEAKDVMINDITIGDLLKKVIKIEKDVKEIDEKYKKRELRLIKTFQKLRGKN